MRILRAPSEPRPSRLRAPHLSLGRPAAGFTLIEVLVALLITSLLMVAVTQILTATRYTRDAIHNIQEMQLAGPAILDLLESDLRGLNVYNRDPSLALRVDNRVMSGLDGDGLDFVTSHDGLVPIEDRDRWLYGDLVEVGYRLRPSPEDNDFLELYRREDFGIDDEPFEGGTFSFLHDRVVAFDVQVFEEDGPEAEPLEEWNAGGNDGQPLPRWIEIELTLELSPRLTREQIRFLPVDKRRVTYRRLIRFPQSLFLAQDLQPVPIVPDVDPPSPDDPLLGGGGDPTGGAGGGGGGLDVLTGGGAGGGTGGGGGGGNPLNLGGG